jgi:hypothetical protein
MSTFTLDPSAPVLDCNAFIRAEDKPAITEWEGYVWRFSFGAYGGTTVYVLTDREALEDALETAAEWLKDNAPGVFTEPDYEDAARDVKAPGAVRWASRYSYVKVRFAAGYSLSVPIDRLSSKRRVRGKAPLSTLRPRRVTVNGGTPGAWKEEGATMRDEYGRERDACDLVTERAETDHTYTESGYLASWEWTVDELPAGPERDAVLREWLRTNDADECDAPAWWRDDAGTDCAGDLTA